MNDIKPEIIVGALTWNSAILWVLALAGFVSVIGGLISSFDSSGLLPSRLAKWIARNRLEDTMKALDRLGVRVRWDDKPRSITESVLGQIKEPSYKKQLREMLEHDTYRGHVQVGEARHFSSEDFIDVIGASTNPIAAQQYAQLLNTHRLAEGISNFDAIATPKTGSPILGYEFSKLTDKQMVLGKSPGTSAKITDPRNVLGQHLALDFPKDLELKGKRVLLVDDSTTGGSKMVSLAKALRDAGALVTDALVLFEPKGKDARKSLSEHGITLHSVMHGPTGR